MFKLPRRTFFSKVHDKALANAVLNQGCTNAAMTFPEMFLGVAEFLEEWEKVTHLALLVYLQLEKALWVLWSTPGKTSAPPKGSNGRCRPCVSLSNLFSSPTDPVVKEQAQPGSDNSVLSSGLTAAR